MAGRSFALSMRYDAGAGSEPPAHDRNNPSVDQAVADVVDARARWAPPNPFAGLCR